MPLSCQRLRPDASFDRIRIELDAAVVDEPERAQGWIGNELCKRSGCCGFEDLFGRYRFESVGTPGSGTAESSGVSHIWVRRSQGFQYTECGRAHDGLVPGDTWLDCCSLSGKPVCKLFGGKSVGIVGAFWGELCVDMRTYPFLLEWAALGSTPR